MGSAKQTNLTFHSQSRHAMDVSRILLWGLTLRL